MQRVIIIGVGNRYRGDDAVGLLVAQRLRSRLPHIACYETGGEGTTLMELWQGADHVVLIDAVASSARPGTIHRLEAHRHPIPAALFTCSTHSFGVAEAIEMARVLGTLPPHLIVYGIAGKDFAVGAPLSPESASAAEEVVVRIVQEIAQRDMGADGMLGERQMRA